MKKTVFRLKEPLMKIAFIVSSVGDSNLALRTINALEQTHQHEAMIISLTKAAQQSVEAFQSPLVTTKETLTGILNPAPDATSEQLITKEQLHTLNQYLKTQGIDYAYIGVPSVSNQTPLQIAVSLEVPVLMAYEFMFKPEKHSLWDYLPALSKKPNVQWALPLPAALNDFEVPKERVHYTGHLSIDNAFSGTPPTKTAAEIQKALTITPEQSFAFLSSTTQPVAIDTDFLDSLLSELKNHPNMQVRLGLHPGIQNFDDYLTAILAVCEQYENLDTQFKIILPDSIISKINKPGASIDHPAFQNLFLRANITGTEAAFVADRIAQAVPGALLNQAVLEGKPAYSHKGKPYLPEEYFSKSPFSFFVTKPQAPRSKDDLGLANATAPEAIARIISAA